jgi:hypothetical protein
MVKHIGDPIKKNTYKESGSDTQSIGLPDETQDYFSLKSLLCQRFYPVFQLGYVYTQSFYDWV